MNNLSGWGWKKSEDQEDNDDDQTTEDNPRKDSDSWDHDRLSEDLEKEFPPKKDDD